MTRAEIQSSFFPRFVVCADDSYAVPTLRWLQGAFWDSFLAERWAKGLKTWERRNDCDNFARAFAQHAQDCHAISTGRDDEGLAVGEFFYTRRTGDGHAIVVAFVDDDHRRVFIEPQNGQVIDLTPAEIASCSFVRF